jgi:hypothetical protein
MRTGSDDVASAPRALGAPGARALWGALLAGVSGLGVGALVYAVTGTAKVLLGPGLAVESPLGWLRGTVMVFVEAVLWGLIGGGVTLLPPTFVALLLLARRAPADGAAFRAPVSASLGLWAALFLPLFVFGLRGRVFDGLLLGASLAYGVRHALRELARRLASR